MFITLQTDRLATLLVAWATVQIPGLAEIAEYAVAIWFGAFLLWVLLWAAQGWVHSGKPYREIPDTKPIKALVWVLLAPIFVACLPFVLMYWLWRRFRAQVRQVKHRPFMFQNVPSWLVEKVRALRDQVDPSDRPQIYYRASGWTIACYLKTDVGDMNADRFLLPQESEASAPADHEWHAHVNRTVLVAETLFLLRNSPGFEELRSRLEGRKLRASFFEMLTAKQFFKAGFEIEARPLTGTRGKDFDFLARRGDEAVQVEVTAFVAPAYSEKTILNALSKKRGQMSADKPGVIYCVMPESWLEDRANLNAELDVVIPKFLAAADKINAVVMWGELRLDFNHDGTPGSASSLVRIPYVNEKARLPIQLPFLIQGQRSESLRKAAATGEGLKELEDKSYDSDYFRWIDTLVPPKA